MNVSWQIPRNCLAWILASQLALIVPHIHRLPWWVTVSYLVCAAWRIMLYQGRWSPPAKGIKILLAAMCFVGIYLSYGASVGLEPTVALLFTGLSLKLLELNSKRDVYIVIFLAYFAALTAFLFAQGIWLAAYILLVLLLVTTSLVALHQHSYHEINFRSFRISGLLFMQAIPLMLVLFIIFPRFEPLWAVPTPSHQATTGISSTMSPGDIANLGANAELAFRVDFEGAVPGQQEMYWRGLVLSNFDGREWSQHNWSRALLSKQRQRELFPPDAQPYRYSIIQEATNQPWIFAMPLAYSDDPKIKGVSDFRLLYGDRIYSRIRYDVISHTNVKLQPQLPNYIRAVETQLPADFNPESRLFAQRLWDESANEQDYIYRVLRNFTFTEFVYSLKAPVLGKHSVDEFLFQTRRGFCSHYASSFTFLMRSVGIPARVVVGYQGGELNPITGTVLVHQFDAHAWVEVWQQGQGWQRYDPTAAVSPARIEFGLEEALKEQANEFLSDSPLSPLKYRDVAWLNEMRMRLDAVNYYWAAWVLDYQGENQLSFLKKLVGEVSPWRVAALFLGIGAVIMLVVALLLFRGMAVNRASPEIKLYLRLCKRLAKAGYPRREDEGAIAYCRRVAAERPAIKPALLAATRAFVCLSYEPLPDAQRAIMLKRLRGDVLRVSRLL